MDNMEEAQNIVLGIGYSGNNDVKGIEPAKIQLENGQVVELPVFHLRGTHDSLKEDLAEIISKFLEIVAKGGQ